MCTFPYATSLNLQEALSRQYPILASDPATAPHFQKQRATFTRGKSLRDLLIRADITSRFSQARIYPCGSTDCTLCRHSGVMVTGNDVGSSEYPAWYRVMGHVSCTTQHIVYVITCLKCLLQGVGECEDPRDRLGKYIHAARLTEEPHELSGCAIEAHFQASSHSLADLSIQFAATIPHVSPT